MPSVQKCADQLREQAYKTLTPQIQSLEDELQNVSDLLISGIRTIGYKLEALRNTELPVTEPVLDDYLQNAIKKRDLEGIMVARFTHEVRRQETQEEILTSLLDSAENYFPKVALYTVRGGKFKGWSSRGFSDEITKSISTSEFLQSDAPDLLEALYSDNVMETGEPSEFMNSICEDSQRSWRFFSLRVLEYPVAILVVGEEEGFASRPQALSIILDCVALRLENIALKIIKNLNNENTPMVPAPVSAGSDESTVIVKIKPETGAMLVSESSPASTAGKSSPQLTTDEIPLDLTQKVPHAVVDTESSTKAFAITSEPLPAFDIDLNPLSASVGIPEPEFASIPTEPSPETDQIETASEPEELQLELVEEEVLPAVPEPEPEPSAVMVATNAIVSEPEPEPEPTIPCATPAAAAMDSGEEATPIPTEPDQSASAAADTSAESENIQRRRRKTDATQPLPLTGQEEEKLHSAAKRFAKLLVSEIKLYNENTVAEGRKNRDIYLRLNKDIDRSRDMYEKRVAPTVACKVDYFHEELVQILGDGDIGVLGNGYTGPRIS